MSYVTLPAVDVLDMCKQWVQDNHADVLALQEPLIQKAMKPKFFGLIKAKTREEAMKHLECSDIFGKFHMIRFCGTYHAYEIKQLFMAAEIAQKFNRDVNVQAQTLAVLYSSQKN